MSRKFWILCCFMLGSSIALAEEPAATPAADDMVAAEDEPLPDAMQHAVKGPEIDFENLRDPFASYLALVASRSQQLLNERMSSISNRKREALENFELATLKLVAIYKKGEDRVAMIQDATGQGYMVRRGNYMGKHNGHIEKISDDTIFLVEQVLNPAGEITDRQVTLTLKEVNE